MIDNNNQYSLNYSRYTNEQVASALAAFDRIFVPTPAHNNLHSRLDALRLLGLAQGKKPHRYLRCLAPASSGKTTVARRFAKNVNDQVQKNSTDIPVLYYSLQNNLTSKSFTKWCIESFGYQTPRSGTEAQFRARLLKLFEHHNVQMMIVDEIHHLRNRRYADDVLNLLKSLVNDSICSIAVLGTLDAEPLLNGSSEFRQRCMFVADIPRLTESVQDRKILGGFLVEVNRQMIDAGICSRPSEFLTDFAADALVETAGGVLGLISRILQAALEISIRRGADYISLEHIRLAVDLWAIPQGVISRNPFGGKEGRR